MSPRAGVLGSLMIGVLCLSATAAAQEAEDSGMLLGLRPVVQRDAEGKLLSQVGGGVTRFGHGPRGGFVFGLDAAGASPLPLWGAEPGLGFAFGARVGYQARNGLAMTLRFDDLGLGPQSGAFQFATFGMRYTFPYPIPMPYLEAAAGVAVVTPPGPLGSSGGTSFWGPGGGLGVGVAIPLSHHVAIDIGLRDWIAPANGTVFQVLSLEVGLDLTAG